MSGLLLALALATTPASAAPHARSGHRSLDVRIADAVKVLFPAVAELRHLEALRDVPVLVEDPAQLREEVVKDSLDEEAVADLQRTVRTLSAFGLMTPDLDLQEAVATVLTEQIGAFYDPDELRLVLVRRDGAFSGSDLGKGSQDEMVAAHELVHALQDQHFDLWRLRNRDFTSDDADTALLALVEGDASWAMLQFTLGGAAGLPADVPDALFAAVVHAGGEVPSTPGLDAIPRVLRDQLVFPYLDGLIFARTLQHARGWAGVDAAFAAPPLSTEQVLHPEKYLDGGDPPLRLDLPDLAPTLGDGWHQVDQGTFGELGIRSILAQKGASNTAIRAVPPGWGGDTYQVLEHTDGTLAAAWVSVWDTDEDAGDAAKAFAALGWPTSSEGRRVTTLVAVPPAAEAAVRAAVAPVVPTPITRLDDVSTPRPEPRAASASPPSAAPR